MRGIHPQKNDDANHDDGEQLFHPMKLILSSLCQLTILILLNVVILLQVYQLVLYQKRIQNQKPYRQDHEGTLPKL